MFPCFSGFDLADRYLMNTVCRRNNGLCPWVGTNGDRLLRCQLGAMMINAFRWVGPSFVEHIRHIFSGGSVENVTGVTARGKVTRVKAEIFKRTVCQLVGDTLCGYVSSIDPNMAIAFRVTTSQPRPTVIRTANVDLAPKPTLQRAKWLIPGNWVKLLVATAAYAYFESSHRTSAIGWLVRVWQAAGNGTTPGLYTPLATARTI